MISSLCRLFFHFNPFFQTEPLVGSVIFVSRFPCSHFLPAAKLNTQLSRLRRLHKQRQTQASWTCWKSVKHSFDFYFFFSTISLPFPSFTSSRLAETTIFYLNHNFYFSFLGATTNREGTLHNLKATRPPLPQVHLISLADHFSAFTLPTLLTSCPARQEIAHDRSSLGNVGLWRSCA